MNANLFVKSLYECVDNKDLHVLSEKLDEDVYFKFSNFEAVTGMAAVLETNENFFSSIKNMRHEIRNVWSQGDDVICNGKVHYTRLNDSLHTAEFATVLTMKNNKITNYLIYADVSLL